MNTKESALDESGGVGRRGREPSKSPLLIVGQSLLLPRPPLASLNSLLALPTLASRR